MARRLDQSLAGDDCCDLPVSERILDNGLKALVLPRRGAPVVVSDLYYPVGSFDEPPGLSGLAHFVEHMLFKGTERFPKGQIDRLVSASAGQCNAETGEDSTHYWFAFPVGSMGARPGDRGRPDARRAVRPARGRARASGHRRGTIPRAQLAPGPARPEPPGRLLPASSVPQPDPRLARRRGADRRRGPLEVLPRSTTAPTARSWSWSATCDPERALDRIAESFGRIPAGPGPRRRPDIVEPRQSGRRDFTMIEADGVARGVLGWRTVPRGHVDTPRSTSSPICSRCGRRSRLWQSLVEADGAATWVEASHAASQRAGQFLIQLEADPDAVPADLERRIREELDRLAEGGPTPEELSRSRHRLEAAWRWEQEELTSLAAGLGNAALWGDWRAWPAEHRAAMAVGPDEIRRVAAAYLIDEGLTVGWSLARAAGEPAETRAPEVPLIPLTGLTDAPLPGRASGSRDHRRAPQPADATTALSLATPTRISRLADYRPRRMVMDNGLRLVYERRPGTGVVALELYVDAGSVREAKPGLAALTGRLLEEGTTSRDRRGTRPDDRGRRRLAGGRLDGGLGPGPRRGPGAGDRTPGRLDAPPGLPARRHPNGSRAGSPPSCAATSTTRPSGPT